MKKSVVNFTGTKLLRDELKKIGYKTELVKNTYLRIISPDGQSFYIKVIVRQDTAKAQIKRTILKKTNSDSSKKEIAGIALVKLNGNSIQAFIGSYDFYINNIKKGKETYHFPFSNYFSLQPQFPLLINNIVFYGF